MGLYLKCGNNKNDLWWWIIFMRVNTSGTSADIIFAVINNINKCAAFGAKLSVTCRIPRLPLSSDWRNLFFGEWFGKKQH